MVWAGGGWERARQDGPKGTVGGEGVKGDGSETKEEGWAVGALFVAAVGEGRRGQPDALGFTVGVLPGAYDQQKDQQAWPARGQSGKYCPCGRRIPSIRQA